MKDKIILNILKYIDTKDNSFKSAALEQLKLLAKHYRVTIKNAPKIELKTALYQFIDNGTGYINTIPKLFNSLK